jgi:hypothetical protein
VAEFDHIQAHFEKHIANLASALAKPKPSTARSSRYAKPSRYIASAARSQQVAGPKAFGSPSVASTADTGRWVRDSVFFARESDRTTFKQPRHLSAPRNEDLDPYKAKTTWQAFKLMHSVDSASLAEEIDPSQLAGLEQMWNQSWATSLNTG